MSRSEQLRLRVTPEEKAELAERARRLRFPDVSAMARRLLFPGDDEPGIDPPVRLVRQDPPGVDRG